MTDTREPKSNMKDTGIPWIGEIPKEANICRLKFFSYMKGRIGWQGLKSKDFIDNGPYCVTGTDFVNGKINWSTCYHVSEERYEMDKSIQLQVGDLLVTKDGTIGKLAKVTELPGKACLNSHLLIIRPTGNKFSNEYLYYVMLSDVFVNYYRYTSTGSIMESLSQEKTREFQFPLHDPSVQQKIVRYLDRRCAAIDSLIASKQALLEKLEEYRKAVITKAVIMGIKPNGEFLSTNIKWLPTIPKHWKVVRLANCFKLVTRSPDVTLPVLSVSIHNGISDKELDDSERSRKVTLSEDRSKYQCVKTDDLVYNMMRAWQGAFGVARINGLVSPAYVVLEPKSGICSKYFEYLLKTPQFQACIQCFSQGIADFRNRLYWDKAKDIYVPLPPFDEQVQIASFCGNTEDPTTPLKTQIEKTIATLKQYRSSLITAAVTGKIDVTDL